MGTKVRIEKIVKHVEQLTGNSWDVVAKEMLSFYYVDSDDAIELTIDLIDAVMNKEEVTPNEVS